MNEDYEVREIGCMFELASDVLLLSIQAVDDPVKPSLTTE